MQKATPDPLPDGHPVCRNAFAPYALSRKVALVAGASGRINLSACRFAEHGANVAILGCSEERIAAPVSRATMAALGPVDIVISDAASNFHTPVAHLSPNGSAR